MHDVFISYAAPDAASAKVVCRAVEDAGITCWIAPRDVLAGEIYADAIVEAISAARAVVVLLSASANASEFVIREVERAVTRGVPVVPLQVDKTSPSKALEFFVSAPHRLDAATPPRPQHLEALVQALGKIFSTDTRRSPADDPRTPRASSAPVIAVASNLPPRNPFFTGREDVIDALRNALDQAGSAAITGMPGVGKTQVALEYANRQRHDYAALLWMRADSRDAFYSDAAVAARLLRLPEKVERRQDRVVDSLSEWLREHAGWLLVLDNADEADTAMRLLSLDGNGHLIVTTRESAGGAIARRIMVTPLDDRPSTDLLLRRCRLLDGTATRPVDGKDRSAASAVARRLGGLPLALDQAGAFIEQTRSTPSEYLQLFRTDATGLLAEGANPTDATSGSVVATFTPAFRRLDHENRAAGDLLRLCAFLAPDGIPEEILTASGCCPGEPLGDAMANPLERLRVVRSALRYSLLERDPETRTVSVHRLVQTVLVAEMDAAEHEAWARRAGMAVAAAFPIPDFSNWPLCERLMPHALTCAEHLWQATIEFPALGRLLNLVGTYLRQRGRHAESQPIQERALDVVQRTSGEDDIQLAWCLHNLSVLHHDAHRVALAEPLARRAHDIAVRLLDPRDPHLTWFMGHLARVYRTQGKYDLAETLLRRSIEVARAADSPDDGQISWPLQGLADLYLERRRFGEAEDLLTEALARRQQVLGPAHPHVAWTMASLAEAYTGGGRHDEAEHLFRDALGIAEQALGKDHGIVAVILGRYSEMLAVTGRREMAREMQERAR